MDAPSEIFGLIYFKFYADYQAEGVAKSLTMLQLSAENTIEEIILVVGQRMKTPKFWALTVSLSSLQTTF